MKKEVYLTIDGMNELKSELEDLIQVRRPNVITALKEARALGDLSENAEYDAARAEQAEVEGRIKEIEAMLENAVIIENVNTDVVSIGTKVKLSYVEDGEIEEYSIVGVNEADPFDNKISNESPLGIALLKHKTGDTVTVSSPTGGYDIKIVNIA